MCVGQTMGRVVQQPISLITLGIADLVRSRRFYRDGFGWKPVFENADIIFYQMNGLMLGTWMKNALADDMQSPLPAQAGGFSLAHNVLTAELVQATMNHLAAFGGRILRMADNPPHGGTRGYIADPDEHVWEIAWNPSWPISPEGYVTFGI